jgi:phosphoribosyl 1,2-cyclic phosphate phosphodiesterase
MQGSPIPVYASAASLADIRRVFYYVGRTDVPPGMYRPEIEFREISAPFDLGPVHVEPLRVVHGTDVTLGFRFECEGRTLGYVPDCHEMPDIAAQRLEGVDVMILDGLRHRPHMTHLTVAESLAVLRRIRARRSYLIHLCHELDHEATQKTLPESVFVSHDGLTLEW